MLNQSRGADKLLVRTSEFGVQYQYGVVLPALVTGSSSRGLLRYIPVVLDRTEEQAVFQYELRDYYIADRSEIPIQEKLVSADRSEVTLAQNGITDLQATLVPVPADTTAARYLHLTSKSGKGTIVRIDLGQIARGRRYAFVMGHGQGATGDAVPNEVKVHSVWKILTETGPWLVMADEGVHLIQADSNVELLALLGKLYPENVVFKEKGQVAETSSRGGLYFAHLPQSSPQPRGRCSYNATGKRTIYGIDLGATQSPTSSPIYYDAIGTVPDGLKVAPATDGHIVTGTGTGLSVMDGHGDMSVRLQTSAISSGLMRTTIAKPG